MANYVYHDKLVCMKEKTDMMIRNVDTELKRQFKSLCALEGTSLSNKIQELMKEAIQKKEVEKHRRDKL